MATALKPLRLFQIGLESTPGTAVAATQKMIGDYAWTPELDKEFEEFPRGVFYPVTGGGVQLRSGSLIQGSGNVTFEELVYMLANALEDPTVTGPGPYVYTFSRAAGTAPHGAIKTLTGEVVEDDGTTKHVEKEFAYGHTASLEISMATNSPTTFTWNIVGRKSADTTMTAALTPVTGRTVIPGNLWALYMDDTWAGLGGTQLLGFLRGFTWTLETGILPDYTGDGRTDLDLTQLMSSITSVRLAVTAELNAAAALELADFDADTIRFIRLLANKSANQQAQFDMAMKHVSPVSISDDEGIRVADFELELEYDPTGGQGIEAVITNDNATL